MPRCKIFYDLPAKSKLLNFTQFNGRFGCTVCKHEGKVVRVGNGSTRVYPYDNSELRTHAESYRLGKMALQRREVNFQLISD